MKVGTKLTLSHLGMALIPVVLLGVITVSIVSKKFLVIEEVADKNGVRVISKQASDGLHQAIFDKLDAVRTIKGHQLEHYFDIKKNDIEILKTTVESIKSSTFTRLNTIQKQKKIRLEELFASLRKDIAMLQTDKTAIDAFEELSCTTNATNATAEGSFNTTTEKYKSKNQQKKTIKTNKQSIIH